MDETQLLMIQAFSLGLVAVLMLIVTCIALVGLLQFLKMQKRFTAFMDSWQPVAKTTLETVEDISNQSSQLLQTLNETTGMMKKQAESIDCFISNFTLTAQRNVESVDSIIQSSLKRINDLSALVEQSLQVSANKLRGVIAGVNAALHELSKGKQKEPGRVSNDEEMFI